jgi:replication factor C subunit 1
MDEVDGVTGNEDRGGLQRLIKLIQDTRGPLIFIANDRQAPKMRTLASHCHEIKFDRPSFTNIKSFMLEICSHEHVRITHASLDNLINACNRDIRKILHTLNIYNQRLSPETEKALCMSAFDACSKMFSTPDISLLDKNHLYFYDASMISLLVQENYIRVVPTLTPERKLIGTQQRMELISKVADSLTLGDICSKLNFANGSRSLMSYQVAN